MILSEPGPAQAWKEISQEEAEYAKLLLKVMNGEISLSDPEMRRALSKLKKKQKDRRHGRNQ